MDEKQLAQAIVDALEQKGVISSNQKDTPKAPTDFTTSTKDASKQVDTFASTVASGSATFGQAVKVLVPGLLGAGDLLKTIASTLDDTRSSFQSLSKVGLGLDANLGDLRMGAADTMMGFDDFVNFIGNNTESLARFGAGLTDGTRVFRDYSRELQKEGIEQFLALGYTVEEANEFLMDNMALNARQIRLGLMNSREAADSSVRLATAMDAMAKLTGEDVKAQRERLREAQRDGATLARLRMLEKQGIQGATEGFNETFQGLEALGPTAQQTFKHLTEMDVPLSRQTKLFAKMNPETFSIMQQLNRINKSSMSVAEKEERRRALIDKATATGAREMDSMTNLNIAAMGSFSEVGRAYADQFAQIEPIIGQMEKYANDIGGELGKSVTHFQAFNGIMEELRGQSEAQAIGGGPGQVTLQGLIDAEMATRRAFQMANSAFAENVEANSVLVGLMKTLAGIDGTSMGNAMVGVMDMLPGNTPNELLRESRIPPATGGDGGDGNGSPGSQGIITSIVGGAATFFTDLLGGEPEANALGGLVRAGSMLKVGERGPETFIAGMDGTVIPNMKYQFDKLQNQLQSTGAPVTQQAQQVMAQLASPGNSTNLERQLDNLNQTMLQLLEINKITKDNSGKQVRAIRNAGNLMTGISIR